MVPGWMQIAIVVLLVVLLFGRGKISDLMGDLAKGIKSFKRGLSDDPENEPEDTKSQAAAQPPPVLGRSHDTAAEVRAKETNRTG